MRCQSTALPGKAGPCLFRAHSARYSGMDTLEASVTKNIAPDVKLGEGVKIYDFVNLYGCDIGDNTQIGTFVEIQKGAKIGKNCKIQSHTFARFAHF